MYNFLKYIVLVVFITNSALLIAQNQQVKIDSLAIIINGKAHDSTKAKALLEAADVYFFNNVDTAKFLCERALKLAIRSQHLEGQSSCYGWLGYIYDQTGNDSLALKNHLKSYEIDEQRKDANSMAISLTNIGYIYRKKGNFKKALEFYNKALHIRNKEKDKQGYGANLNNIASLYRMEGELEMAIKYFKESYKIMKAIKFESGEAYLLANLGVCYGEIAMKNNLPLDTALFYHGKALEIRLKINDQKGIVESFNNLARLSNYSKHYYKGKYYAAEAFKIANKLGSKRHVATASSMMAESFLNLNNLDSARFFAENAYQLSIEASYPEQQQEAAKMLRIYYERKKNFEKALHYSDIYILLKDSLVNEGNKKAALKQSLQYEYDKQKVLDEKEHEKSMLIKQQKEKKQQIIIWAILCVLIVVIVFSVFLQRRFKLTKKQNVIIEKQKKEVDFAYNKLHEKNKEVMDSIHYAARIQRSLITGEKYISKFLNRKK